MVVRARSDLRPYQERLAAFARDHEASAAWVFMGAGKTVATLTAFADLQSAFDANKLLVAAPLRVARTVWHTEIAAWEHLRHLTVSRVLGTEAQRKAALNAEADVYTINRENIPWLRDQFILERKQYRRWPFDMVVLDESQSYKSQGSKRFKALRQLRRLFPRLVELTGTPSPNGLADLWAQMFLIDRGQRLGLTESAFRDRWFNPPAYDSFRWTPKPHAEKEIHSAVADVVLSLREKDYFDLPEVLPTLVRVQLPGSALDKYKRFERHYIMETFAGRVVSAVSAGVCVGKRMQLANGFIYTDTGERRYEAFHDEKIKALLETVESIDGPVIVVYNFWADYARIVAALRSDLPLRRVAKLDTEQSVEDWNAGRIDVLLLHPEAAGHGLNLQGCGCEHIVWFGLTYNLEHIQQVFARLGGGHRRGDRALVVAYIVADDTVDAEVVESVDGKALTQERLMEAVARLADQRETRV